MLTEHTEKLYEGRCYAALRKSGITVRKKRVYVYSFRPNRGIYTVSAQNTPDIEICGIVNLMRHCGGHLADEALHLKI